jgi:hypothetical protein
MKKKYLFSIILLFLSVPVVIWAAQKTIVTYTWDRDINVSGKEWIPGPGTDSKHKYDNSASTQGSVSINETEGTINLGNSINDSCGVAWYTADNPFVANCTEGKCDFGCGFRAYFEFRFTTTDTHANSTDRGDGFTFAVINGANNTYSSSLRGGPAGTASMGELMCYAGTGSSGVGLRSPKFAVEFDTYGNTGAMNNNGCLGGRADPNNLNHIALMFWGDNKAGNCTVGGTSCAQSPYDDNIHNQCVSSCTNPGPVNSTPGDGGYCQRLNGKVNVGGTTYNWMEDGQTHRVRVEVRRPVRDVAGSYPYEIKAWVDCEQPCCSGSTCTSCPESEIAKFQNIFAPYTNESFPPKISRTVQLSAADHANFEKMIFGWTEGTGGATQNILISNIKLYFPCSALCYVDIDPISRSHSARMSTGNTISVTADANCSWTAVSNDSWIIVTDGNTGTGNGTVTYRITTNATGASRTGTIIIGGQVFTVEQESPCPAYTVYNRVGGWRDFTVSGSSCIRAQNNSPLGVPLELGGTVTRYGTTTERCWWPQGTRTYEDAIEADINGNCNVRYNSNDTLTDQ